MLSAALGAAPAGKLAGPTPATRPAIAGSATQGSRLAATPGTWQGSGRVRYRYRWYRCDTMGGHCSPLRGATGPRRKLNAADVGHTLGLDVRATDSTGSKNGYASLIGPISGAPSALRSIGQPIVSGSAAPGGSVQVDTGKWSTAPTSLAYQWLRCNANGRTCAPIAGDTTNSHAIVRRDVAHALVAIVQARSRATSQAVLSLATAPVPGSAAPTPAPTPPAPTPPPTSTPTPTPTPTVPVLTAPPAIVGTAQQGKQLTGSTGTWSGSGTLQYHYQWYRCDPAGAHCKSIHGSTKPTYTQVGKDAAATLGLTIQATDAAGTTSAYASLVGPVAARAATLVSTVQPTVSGTPNPGQALQVTPGTWSQTPTALAYQWQRCNANGRLCAAIAGATAAAYTATAADTGHALLAVVQATAGGATQASWSAASPAITAVAGPVLSARPTVTGVAQAGMQLVGSAGTWSGSGTIQYHYQWYRCDPAGAHCESIHGATKATYTQVAKDGAHTLGLTVRATDAAGTSTAYASLLGPVAAAAATLVSTVQPTVSGTPGPGKALQVSSGAWSRTPTALAYQWQRCNANGRLCAAIAGATAASYTLTAADAGHALLAVVQAAAAGLRQTTISVAAVA